MELGGRVSPPQCSAREGAGILAVFDDDLAIHNDVVNAYRVVMRVFSSGVGLDCGGVENNDVRLEAVSQDTSVRQSEALGRERCHLAKSLRRGAGASRRGRTQPKLLESSRKYAGWGIRRIG